MTVPPVPPTFTPGIAPRPKNNTFAVVGFVLSLVCCAPLGLGFAIAGLMQINKDPENQLGKGFAIAGIVLGAIGILVGILYFFGLVALFGSSDYSTY